MPENIMASKGTKRLPLSVFIEGKSWVLTTFLEAAVAIWMVLFGELIATIIALPAKRLNFLDDWGFDVIKYLAYLTVGFILGVVAVGAMQMNVRPLNQRSWRYRSFWATIALVVIDNAAIGHGYLAGLLLYVPAITTSEELAILCFAVAFMFITELCFVVVANVLFIKEFGFCLCIRRKRVGERIIKSTEEWLRHKSPLVAQSSDPEAVFDTSYHSPSNVVDSADYNGNELYDIEIDSKDEARCNQKKVPSMDNIEFFINSQNKPSIDRWKTYHLVELCSMYREENSSSPSTSQALIVNTSPEDDKDKGNCQLIQEQETLKGNLSVRGMLKVFKSWIQNTWSAFKEEPKNFKYMVWIKSAFLAGIAIVIYYSVISIAIIYALVNSYNNHQSSALARMIDFGEALIDAVSLTSENEPAKFLVRKFCEFVDKVISNYHTAATLGYTAGAMLGICSLCNVLIQHKRMHLAALQNIRTFKSKMNGYMSRKYPMVEACMFLAILISTAVLQALIAGGLISIVIGISINIRHGYILLQLLAPSIVAYLLILVIDMIVMTILRSGLLSDDGETIRHPHWFNFTMVVLSMVHLAIGLLYAFWRLIYATIATTFALNRLDICLFPVGKSLDNGHNAFMSMLVLSVLMQQDSADWENTIERTEDDDVPEDNASLNTSTQF